MHELYVALAVVGGLLLVLGLFTGLINRAAYASEPLIAIVAGVLIGPAALRWLDLSAIGNEKVILEQASLVTLAVALVGVALRLPVGFITNNWKPLAVLLGLVMPLMWMASGLLIYLLLGIPFLVALLIGAIVTPTDPVVSSSIVTGDVAEENLPGRLRHLISAESGYNDGLALPFVLLPLLLLTRSPGDGLSYWFVQVILWEVAVGAAVGILMGYAAGKLLVWAETKRTTAHTSILSISLALALSVLGITELIGVNGVLATFVAGTAFNVVGSSDTREQREHVQDAITRFFDLPVFVLLGMALPWEGWFELGWVGLVLAAAVLLLRRPPVTLALSSLIAPAKGRKDALFLGWFGPLGAAALYYAAFSVRETGLEQVWVVGSLLICASVLAHGVSATPLTKLYGRTSGQTDRKAVADHRFKRDRS
ncbi:MAG: cation:proton antiporter [Actinomycetota bacterium]|nr:cation:proton antiporter [Actinomycetota bacterium]